MTIFSFPVHTILLFSLSLFPLSSPPPSLFTPPPPLSVSHTYYFFQTRAKIINWCLKHFHQCRNHEVLKECLLCIHFLNSFNKNIKIEKMLKSQVLTEFIELLKSENVETEILNLVCVFCLKRVNTL